MGVFLIFFIRKKKDIVRALHPYFPLFGSILFLFFRLFLSLFLFFSLSLPIKFCFALLHFPFPENFAIPQMIHDFVSSMNFFCLKDRKKYITRYFQYEK